MDFSKRRVRFMQILVVYGVIYAESISAVFDQRPVALNARGLAFLAHRTNIQHERSPRLTCERYPPSLPITCEFTAQSADGSNSIYSVRVWEHGGRWRDMNERKKKRESSQFPIDLLPAWRRAGRKIFRPLKYAPNPLRLKKLPRGEELLSMRNVPYILGMLRRSRAKRIVEKLHFKSANNKIFSFAKK